MQVFSCSMVFSLRTIIIFFPPPTSSTEAPPYTLSNHFTPLFLRGTFYAPPPKEAYAPHSTRCPIFHFIDWPTTVICITTDSFLTPCLLKHLETPSSFISQSTQGLPSFFFVHCFQKTGGNHEVSPPSSQFPYPPPDMILASSSFCI